MTNPIDPTGWLPNTIGPLNVEVAGETVDVPRRQTFNLDGFSVEDEPDFDRTRVVIGLFRDRANGVTHGEARSAWGSSQTLNATPKVIQMISVPATDWGDCLVTVTWEVTVAASSGGGNMARKAVFRRNSGTLAAVNQDDNSVAADLTIATAIAGGVVDNDTIKLTATGISSTVNWIVSTHIQIAKEP